ncbi:MAG: FMN-binding glutamate synthase family protein [bacterium]|nr:FMN-binding glutamate synthase family protein [bacterium]
MEFTDFVLLVTFGLLLVMMIAPVLVLAALYWSDRRQAQHAVLRNFPLLGRLRYFLEHLGPELRQYLFDADREGKPFSRDQYLSVVFSGKYLKSLIGFGSKRDFEKPGWYLRNTLLPVLMDEMAVVRQPRIETRTYQIDEEGLFRRSERMVSDQISPWRLSDDFAPVIGEGLPHPWKLRGLIGMSGMSYGALGRNAILAISKGVGRATGSWINTGEGGLSPHHLAGGGDIVFQIGPGLFGVRTQAGEWDWDLFAEQAARSQVRGFELKFHQGAKIRGGHVEGVKVTSEIAGIRRVPVGKTIDSPNRFTMLASIDETLDWIARMRQEGGKPVGLKIVVGGPGACDPLAQAMARRGDGPDWITVDGGEGGSGASYQEMAETMGLPVRSGIVALDDALRRAGVRERVKVFASGMLLSPDRIALALCLGADAVNIARALMISVGCIQAQKCHTNTCPVGVATTDENLMTALVVEEKCYRVLNYVVTMRAGLTSLAAAAGIHSPTQFERKHAVYRDAFGRVYAADELFPLPETSERIT